MLIFGLAPDFLLFDDFLDFPDLMLPSSGLFFLFFLDLDLFFTGGGGGSEEGPVLPLGGGARVSPTDRDENG